jgi:hypothetical protein
MIRCTNMPAYKLGGNRIWLGRQLEVDIMLYSMDFILFGDYPMDLIVTPFLSATELFRVIKHVSRPIRLSFSLASNLSNI